MKTDRGLKLDVQDELSREPSLDASHIAISVHEGIVTLIGHVPSYAEKDVTEMTATRVQGVKAVADEREVRLHGTSEPTDEDVAAACVSRLSADYLVQDERIKVVVSNGWVALEGEVEWKYQKEAAGNAIRDATGVRGVSNHITVKPRASPADINSKIEAALKRSAEVDARQIALQSENGTVILRGMLRKG
jgi:osmotically-inducible protein OsmY